MVPVLYKISTVVDRVIFFVRLDVPVLYKISTVVDYDLINHDRLGSRSLQNFYCCRSRGRDRVESGSRSLQNFYCCRFCDAGDGVLRFPFFTKFLLL